MSGFWRTTYEMYRDGFRNMTIGRYLWAIIIVKLMIMFLVLKAFFFPNILKRDYDTEEERAEAVRDALTGPRESIMMTISN